MKKILNAPFLLALLLTMLVAATFVWKEMGLFPSPTGQQAEQEPPAPQQPEQLLPEQPELRDPPEDPISPPAPQTPAEPQPPEPAFPEPVPDQPEEPEEPEEPSTPVKPEDPFTNALFIGDSRTVGIAEYSGITEADFFAFTGMSVYTAFKKESAVGSWQKGTLLADALQARQYDRVYLMLGVNELGYNFQKTVERYGEMVQQIRELQPDAYLILEASLHVTKKRSDTDATFNNSNIDRMNQAQAAYADGEHIFFIDVNPAFDDETGALNQDYTFDNTHPYGKYYSKWADWLRENTPA